MAEPTNNASPFVPQAAAASQRMADSVFDRLSGGGRTRLPERSAPVQTPEKRTSPSLQLQTEAPRSRPLRAVDVIATQPKERAPASAAPPTFPTVTGSWEPPEVARAGLRARDAGEGSGPLWGVLSPVQVEPVLAAVESVLAQAAPPRPQPVETAASMPVVSPIDSSTGSSAPSSQPMERERPVSPATVSKADIDASLRMMDALRAHASMHAVAGDNRISLGDMTLIAFAEKKQQLAAAMANSMPEPKEPDRPLGDIPNPKVFSNQNSLLHKIREIAQEMIKKDDEAEKYSDSRYGGS